MSTISADRPVLEVEEHHRDALHRRQPLDGACEVDVGEVGIGGRGFGTLKLRTRPITFHHADRLTDRYASHPCVGSLVLRHLLPMGQELDEGFLCDVLGSTTIVKD